MINIVCLKWGDLYGAEYVNRLSRAVKRNTSLSFKFHCFTDSVRGLDPDIRTHALPYNHLKGWWNKLYLFSREIAIAQGEKIFYIDLDTLITDNIDDLLQQPVNKITVLRDFLNGIARTAGEMGSGLMMWRHGDYEHIWTQFIKNPKYAMELVYPHGDQHWIDHCVSDRFYWQELLPDRVVSFKVHCRSGLPEKAAIVCYHGRPSIPESVTINERIWKFDLTPQPWVLDYWKD